MPPQPEPVAGRAASKGLRHFSMKVCSALYEVYQSALALPCHGSFDRGVACGLMLKTFGFGPLGV